METASIVVRQAGEADFDGWFDLHAAVAAEGKWIGRELPLDREESRRWYLDNIAGNDIPGVGLVAVVAGKDPLRSNLGGRSTSGPLATAVRPDGPGSFYTGPAQVGQLGLHLRSGIGDVGMAVDAGWRGRGVGSALMATAIGWAREHEVHKLALQLWPHNTTALRLYQKFGFVEEGRLHRQYRRRNGELWDAIVMGLVLDTTSPGSSHEP